MKVTFFTALLNIKLSSIPGRGDQIADGLYIATDASAIRSQLGPEVVESIGGIETAALLNAPGIIYSQEDIADQGDSFEWFSYLNTKLAATKLFLFCSWLRKDNAADVELGFLTYPKDGGMVTHSNFFATKNSKADGSMSSESFDREDIRNIRSLYRQIVTSTQIGTPADVRMTQDTNRINRAFYWAQSARHAADLAERLVYQSTVLEAMLSTSAAELLLNASDLNW